MSNEKRIAAGRGAIPADAPVKVEIVVDDDGLTCRVRVIATGPQARARRVGSAEMPVLVGGTDTSQPLITVLTLMCLSVPPGQIHNRDGESFCVIEDWPSLDRP